MGEILLLTTVLEERWPLRAGKSSTLEVAVFRWHFLRQQDATAGVHHHAGPPPGLIRRKNGGPTLPACTLRRSFLGRRHLGSSG